MSFGYQRQFCTLTHSSSHPLPHGSIRLCSLSLYFGLIRTSPCSAQLIKRLANNLISNSLASKQFITPTEALKGEKREAASKWTTWRICSAGIGPSVSQSFSSDWQPLSLQSSDFWLFFSILEGHKDTPAALTKFGAVN